MPAATTISKYSPASITEGIKYIKINRFDEQGNDNTISLQELTNLRLLFEDLGIVDFPILSISEYSDYYLYRVGPVVLGESTSKFKSPTDPNTATNTYTLTSGSNTSPIFYGYTDTTGSIGGTGLYNFPNGGYTVTATCYFSASATASAKEDFYILFTGSNGIINKQIFSPYLGSPGVGSYSASISYVPTSGSTLGIAFASSSVNVSFNLPSIDFRITQDITSSVDNNILDHTFSASAYLTSSKSCPASVESFITGSVFNVNNNPLNYFNTSTGIYTYGDTPNVDIIYTASAKFYPTSGTQSIVWGIAVDPTSDPQPVGAAVLVSASGQLSSFSGKFSPIENGKYYLVVANFSTNSIGVDTINWSFSQVESPQTSSVLTVLEPYLTTDFFYNDCNVLYGNADGLEYDDGFMRVLYDNGSVIPSNQSEILSNTAERAPVKPYNYALKAQILPRYNGVRTTSPDFNQIAENQYGQVPNVEQTTTYFIYFTELSDTSPLLKDNTSAKTPYLIGEDGTLYDINTDAVSYLNLINSFQTSKQAYATLFSNVSTIFTNTQSISLSGTSYVPILYTISSSILGNITWTGQIDFNNLQGTSATGAPDFAFQKYPTGSVVYTRVNQLTLSSDPSSGRYGVWQGYSPAVQLNTSSSVNPFIIGTGSLAYNSILGYDSQSGYSQGSPLVNWPNEPYYEFTVVPLSSVNITFTAYVTTYAGVVGFSDSTYNGNATYKLHIWSSTNPTVPLNTAIFNSPSYQNIYSFTNPQSVSINNYYPTLNEKIWVTIEHVGGDPIALNYLSANSWNFNPTNLKITTNNLTIPSAIPPYWLTGSANSTILTSSLALGISLQGNYQQVDISSSLMPKIDNEAMIMIGDEFRFEYDEANVFKVTNVVPATSGSSPIIYVTVDRPIPTSPALDIDHFVVRRLQKDVISGVTLNAKLTKPISNGYLFPEFPSDAIKANLPKITENLRSRNIIQ